MIRVLLAGNTDFSQYILEGLASHFKVVGLITAPSKRAGRGLKYKEPAIASYALAQGIPLLQPTNLKDVDFLKEIHRLAPQICVVVAFRKIPKELWQIPSHGTFNLHTSLLPKYRGAAPIQHAIIRGEKETGVTTFLINDRIDTGEILMQKRIAILPEECFGNIYQKLKPVGMTLVIETVNKLFLRQFTPTPQPQQEKPLLAPKISATFCKITYPTHSDPEAVHNHIRGLSPKPSAWIWIWHKGKRHRYKVIRSLLEATPSSYSDRLEIGEKGLGMVFDKGKVWIQEGQLEGKKPMSTSDMLNGWGGKSVRELYWQ